MPQNEVERVILARVVGIVAALVGDGEHGRIIVQADSASHDTKFRVVLHAKVDAATAFIGKAARHQGLYDLDHRGGLLRGACVDVGAAYIQRVHVAQIAFGLAPPQFVPGHAEFA